MIWDILWAFLCHVCEALLSLVGKGIKWGARFFRAEDEEEM